MELVIVPTDPSEAPSKQDARSRRGKPSYGLGLMGDPVSPWGLAVGHNGGGPCYSASAFHAFDLGGASVCAMEAIEEGFNAEAVVFDVLDRLAAGDNARRPTGLLNVNFGPRRDILLGACRFRQPFNGLDVSLGRTFFDDQRCQLSVALLCAHPSS